MKKKRYRQNLKWRARTRAKILLAKANIYKEILALQQKQNEAIGMPEVITAKEVQCLFEIVPSTYYRWVKAGWLMPTAVGGRHYYEKKYIIELLQRKQFRKRGRLK